MNTQSEAIAMISTDNLIICCIIMLTLIVGILGYLLGRLNELSINQNSPQSFFKKHNSSNNSSQDTSSVSIDDKKFVANINTSGMEKKYDALGDTKKSDENISGSINKLKTLKG